MDQKVVEPGNGSRYHVVAGVAPNGTPFVALPDYGVAAVMEWRHFVHPSYAQEKLGRGLGTVDVIAVTKILNHWNEEAA